MTENKSCLTCQHSQNVRLYRSTNKPRELTTWSCDEIPTSFRDFESETAFETFYCSLWKNMFEDLNK